MVLLYRFSLEVEKAKTTNNLNAMPLLFNRNIDVPTNNGALEFNNGNVDVTIYLIFVHPTIVPISYNWTPSHINIYLKNTDGPSSGRTRANPISEADDEMSDNKHYFATNWGGMEISPGYWESMIDHGYTDEDVGNIPMEAPLDIINLTTDLSMEEISCPLNQNCVIDIEGSSTGSTNDGRVYRSIPRGPFGLAKDIN